MDLGLLALGEFLLWFCVGVGNFKSFFAVLLRFSSLNDARLPIASILTFSRHDRYLEIELGN